MNENQKRSKSQKAKKFGNKKFSTKPKGRLEREQPRKDSPAKRENLDNVRVDKLADLFVRKDSNHVDWVLKKDAMSTKFAANIPFSSVTGRDNGFRNPVPGVMRLTWSPTFGSPDTDVLSALKESYYSYVVHANSRNKLYDPNDLLMLTLGTMEVFTKITEMKRAYGLMREWNGSNEYTPEILLRAMGYKFEDLQTNYPIMLDSLNLLIAETKQLWIPNTFPVLDRYLWLATNIFTDAETEKAQYYVPVRGQYFMYDELLSPSGGVLRPATYSFLEPTDSQFWDATFNLNTTGSTGSMSVGVLTWEQHLRMLRNMIIVLRNAQDRGIICGDILKAYGPEKIVTITPLDPDFKTVPAYNEEVQWQIENTTIMNNYPVIVYQDQLSNQMKIGYSSQTVEQSSSRPTPNSYSPQTSKMVANAAMAPSGALLNFHQKQNPTPEQVLVATRHTATGMKWEVSCLETSRATAKFDVYYGFKPFSAGSTIVTGISIFNALRKDTGEFIPVNGNNFIALNGLSTISQQIAIINGEQATAGFAGQDYGEALRAFDWCPAIYMYLFADAYRNQTAINDNKGYPVARIKILTDFENYQLVSNETLANIHNFCVYSEFDVPTLG